MNGRKVFLVFISLFILINITSMVHAEQVEETEKRAMNLDIIATAYRPDPLYEDLDILVRWVDRTTMAPIPIKERNITKHLGPGYDYNPKISPCGKYIIWVRSVDPYSGDPYIIWKAKIDGTEAAPIKHNGTPVEGVWLSWAITPQQENVIAFTVYGDWQIKVLNLDTNELVDVGQKDKKPWGKGTYPVWAQSGERLFFINGFEVYTSKYNNLGQVSQVPLPGYCYKISWLPDGSLDCITSWWYEFMAGSHIVNFNFQDGAAVLVEGCFGRTYARDPKGENWIVYTDELSVIIEHLVTGEITYKSPLLYQEMYPDWWSPQAKKPNLINFERWFAKDPAYSTEFHQGLPVSERFKLNPVCAGYEGVSLVDCLKYGGRSSSYQARSFLARWQGIYHYSGNATQNLTLLKLIRGEQH